MYTGNIKLTGTGFCGEVSFGLVLLAQEGFSLCICSEMVFFSFFFLPQLEELLNRTIFSIVERGIHLSVFDFVHQMAVF